MPPWRAAPTPILGLDIGDCLSDTSQQWADEEQFRTAATGAYAFVVMFTILHGPASVHLFANRAKAFVEQFGFREIGVPMGQVHDTYKGQVGQHWEGPSGPGSPPDAHGRQ